MTISRSRWSVALLFAVVGCGPEKDDGLTVSTSLTTLPGTFPNSSEDPSADDEEGGSSQGTSGGVTEGSATNASNASNVSGAETSETGAPGTSTTQVTTDPPVDTGETFPPDSTSGDTRGFIDPPADSSSGDTRGFIDDTSDPPGECDIWAEDCPNGQKCMPIATNGGSWDATACVPVQGSNAPGESCTYEGSGTEGLDDCKKHAICLGPEANEGTCVGMCTGSEVNPVCPAGQVCDISNNGVLILCVDVCDPLGSDCKVGEVCIGSGDQFVCAIDASGTDGQQHDACEYTNVCDPGLACIQSELDPDCNQNFAGCCSPYCDLDNPDCTGTLTCEPWYEQGQAPPGNEDVGVCVSL